jgi:hypothetical protein
MSDEDWNAIKLVSEWLGLFKRATAKMSTTKKPMLSQTRTIFRTLQSAVKSSICNLPAPINSTVTHGAAQRKLQNGLVQAHLKLSEYFSRFETSPYYLWAARELGFTLYYHCSILR